MESGIFEITTKLATIGYFKFLQTFKVLNKEDFRLLYPLYYKNYLDDPENSLHMALAERVMTVPDEESVREICDFFAGFSDFFKYNRTEF